MSLQWASCVPLCCWLVFHNSVWEWRSVHSVNMLYTFMFVIVDFFQNWVYFEFFCDVLIPLMVKQYVFCGSEKFHCRCCYSGLFLLVCFIFVIWFASGHWKVVELGWWFLSSVRILIICLEHLLLFHMTENILSNYMYLLVVLSCY
jgi:hypothetical protein